MMRNVSAVHLLPGEVRLKVVVHIILDDLVDGLPDGSVRPLEVLQLLLEQDVVLLGLGLLLVAHGGGGGRGRGGGGGGGGGLLAGGRGPVGHRVVTVLTIHLHKIRKYKLFSLTGAATPVCQGWTFQKQVALSKG